MLHKKLYRNCLLLTLYPNKEVDNGTTNILVPKLLSIDINWNKVSL